jgi:hypothetical protein
MVDKTDASKAAGTKPADAGAGSQEAKPESAEMATIGTVAPCGTIASVATIGTLAAAQSTPLGGAAAAQPTACVLPCVVGTMSTSCGAQASIHATTVATIHATIHYTIGATIHATHGTLAECAGTAPCAASVAAGSTPLGGVRAAAPVAGFCATIATVPCLCATSGSSRR